MGWLDALLGKAKVLGVSFWQLVRKQALPALCKGSWVVRDG